MTDDGDPKNDGNDPISQGRAALLRLAALLDRHEARRLIEVSSNSSGSPDEPSDEILD